MKLPIRKILVTLFLVSAAVGLGILLYLVTGRVNISQGKEIKVSFDYIGSVTHGTNVRKSGVRVGVITEVEISQEDQKTVFLTIRFLEGQTVRIDDKFGIASRGILGDQTLEVYPGPVDSPEAPDGWVFKGVPMLDTNSILIEGSELVENLNATALLLREILETNKDKINSTMENIEIGAQSIRDIGTPIKQVIPAFTKDLRIIMSNLTQASEDIKRLSSNLAYGSDSMGDDKSIFTTLGDDDMPGQIADIMTDLEASAEAIRLSTETLQAGIEEFFKMPEDTEAE